MFIKANIHEILNENELNLLSSKYEEFTYRDMLSLCTILSHDPTYKILSNRYRIPDENNWNDQYKKEATLLDEIMSIEEIKSIDYWEYVDENIHCAVDYERSMEESNYEVASGRDINLVATRYKEFLLSSKRYKINTQLINELDRIIELASIAQKYNKDVWFYDGYYWQ